MTKYEKEVALRLAGVEYISSTEKEAHFSWQSCSSCGSSLGGDRYEMMGVLRRLNGDTIRFEVCTDCLLYHIFGDVPEVE